MNSGGAGPAARAELRKAIRLNPYVWTIPDSDMPTPSPQAYVPGSPEEAVVILDQLGDAFESTLGFADFILDEGERFLPAPPRKKARPARSGKCRKKR